MALQQYTLLALFANNWDAVDNPQMTQTTNVDIGDYSFHEFVDFEFDHDVEQKIDAFLKAEERHRPWYHRMKTTCGLRQPINSCVRLFTDPVLLPNRTTNPA
jgi:hypothetical protein